MPLLFPLFIAFVLALLALDLGVFHPTGLPAPGPVLRARSADAA